MEDLLIKIKFFTTLNFYITRSNTAFINKKYAFTNLTICLENPTNIFYRFNTRNNSLGVPVNLIKTFMRKRYILFLLSFFFVFNSFSQSVLNPNDSVITYNPNLPPTQPPFGQIGKWVRTKRLSWNTTEYKCYIYKGCAFRLHFPKSYNPTANDGKKYPMIIFFHGLGETGSIYDNEYQLYHGGDVFQAAINSGKFDGMQYICKARVFGEAGNTSILTEIINYMVANNKLDPFWVSDNGLSAGGQASWEMLLSYPTYLSSALPMSSTSIGYKTPAL
jgi:hypothetical protein